MYVLLNENVQVVRSLLVKECYIMFFTDSGRKEKKSAKRRHEERLYILSMNSALN